MAIVLDLFSRRVVRWALRVTLQTELVAAALHVALGQRRPQAGLVHHSDQGVQYASADYQRLLAAHGIVPSMRARRLLGQRRRGKPLQHLEVRADDATLADTAHCRVRIASYIDYYNAVRRHSTLGYQAPAAFEAAGVM